MTFAGKDATAPDWTNIDILEEGGHIKSDYVIGDCYINLMPVVAIFTLCLTL